MTERARLKYAGARVTLKFFVRMESAMNLVKPILALSLGASSLLAIAVAAHEPATKPMANNPSMQLHAAMMDMQGMQMTGDVDRDFASMMAVHHRQAIRMAEIETANGSNPKLKALAEKMRKDQAAEIKQLEQFK